MLITNFSFSLVPQASVEKKSDAAVSCPFSKSIPEIVRLVYKIALPFEKRKYIVHSNKYYFLNNNLVLNYFKNVTFINPFNPIRYYDRPILNIWKLVRLNKLTKVIYLGSSKPRM